MASSAPAAPSLARSVTVGFVLDLVVLGIFIAAGRQTHEGTGWTGFAVALWPFLAVLVLAWILVLISRRSPDARSAGQVLGLWPVGYFVWIGTTFGGLTLRALTGGGVSGMFPLVATGMIGAGFLGWRLVGVLLRRRRNR